MINENPIRPCRGNRTGRSDNRVWSAFYLTIYALLIAVTISVVAMGW